MDTIQLLDVLASVIANYVDKNALLYFKQKIDSIYATKEEMAIGLNNKVDKVEGKGLSTNDFTTDEKNKLKNLNNYALPTATSAIKGGVKVGAGLSITEDGILSATGGGTTDAVEWENVIGKPTKLSQFTNDSGFQTSAQVNSIVDGKGFLKCVPSEYITETELNGKGYLTSVPAEYVTDSELSAKGYQTATQVNNAITSKGYQTASQVQTIVNNAQHMKREIVSQLPQPSSANELTIYLIDNKKGSYDEYMLINGKLDKVGASDVNLDGYLNTTNFKPLSNEEIDSLFV